MGLTCLPGEECSAPPAPQCWTHPDGSRYCMDPNSGEISAWNPDGSPITINHIPSPVVFSGDFGGFSPGGGFGSSGSDTTIPGGGVAVIDKIPVPILGDILATFSLSGLKGAAPIITDDNYDAVAGAYGSAGKFAAVATGANLLDGLTDWFNGVLNSLGIGDEAKDLAAAYGSIKSTISHPGEALGFSGGAASTIDTFFNPPNGSPSGPARTPLYSGTQEYDPLAPKKGSLIYSLNGSDGSTSIWVWGAILIVGAIAIRRMHHHAVR